MRHQSGNHWLVMIAVVFVLFALLPCGTSERIDMVNEGEEILQVNYTVGFQSDPTGLDLEIDGISYISPVHFVWQEGEAHNIAAPSPQIIDARSRYVWSTWSDYGPRSHTIIVMGDEYYTAYYDTEYMVNVSTSPAALDISIDGCIYSSPVNSFWWVEGSTHELEALLIQPVHPEERWLFLGWNDGVRLPRRTVVVNGPGTYIAMYDIEYNITLTTIPVGLDMRIDGITYSTPFNVWWVEGSTHELEAILPPGSGGGMKIIFVGWSDGVRLPRRTVVVDGPETYTAIYRAIYLSAEFPEPPISDGPVHSIGG